MKKIKLLKTLLIPTIGITAIGTIATLSTGCSPVIIVTGVSLDKESLTLDVGNSDTLIATVLPENATDKSVNWTSSDSSVATVDNNGNVTAVGKGQAIITVTTKDGAFTDTCQVTVHQEIIHVIGAWLDKNSLPLEVGNTKALIATVFPENATDKSVTWSSSDSSVVSVDNNGNVTAVSEGSAEITVKTNDGGYTATSQVAVYQQIIHATDVSLNKRWLTLEMGGYDTLIASVYPYNVSHKSVTWSSSDSSVASVDNNGKVTALSEGPAKITVTTDDGGFTDTCQVTVHYPQMIHVTGVSLDKESLALDEGDSDTLAATVHPENATDKSVTWSSSDSSVATVDNNGKVTAVSEGSAKITVTTHDGGYEDYCDVTVLEHSAFHMCVTANADSTLELINDGGNNPDLRYSDDHKIWHNYSGTISIPAGSMYCLKGNNPTGWSQSSAKFSHFLITGNVSISGNVMGLLDNGTGTISSIPNDYCFYGLFNNSTGITIVSENFLPATTLTNSCYSHMFISCPSLTTVPTLPATTLVESCYHSMFAYCTSLTVAPDLPATTIQKYSYAYMFQGCTSLTQLASTPKTFPATTLAEYSCTFMFANCISLTFFPDLLATNLDTFCCQSMFQGCENLDTMPALPATKLAGGCYSRMFHSCSHLFIASTLPATELAPYCYYDMFRNCSSLGSVRIGYAGTAAEAPENAFSGDDGTWVYNVFGGAGVFRYTGADQDPIDNFGFPSYWIHKPY